MRRTAKWRGLSVAWNTIRSSRRQGTAPVGAVYRARRPGLPAVRCCLCAGSGPVSGLDGLRRRRRDATPPVLPSAAQAICMHRSFDSLPQKSSDFEFGVCNSDHSSAWKEAILLNMDTTTHILTIDKDSHDGIIVTFSDGTIGGSVLGELLKLRPAREPIKSLRETECQVPT